MFRIYNLYTTPPLSKMFKQYITYMLTVFIILFGITTAAHSQTTPSESIEASTTGPKLRALSLGYQDGLKNLEILDATLQSVGKLSLRQFTFSKEFTCPVVNGKLTFGVPNGTDENGNPLFKPVASVKWKNSYKEICLIFIPKSLIGKSGSTAQYAVQVMDMSTRGFEVGHTKTINFTPFDAMVRIGEHQAVVKPWAKSEFPIVTEFKDVKMAQISVMYKYKDEIYNATQTRYRYLESARYITLIYPDLKNKTVGVKTVKDFGNLF